MTSHETGSNVGTEGAQAPVEPVIIRDMTPEEVETLLRNRLEQQKTAAETREPSEGRRLLELCKAHGRTPSELAALPSAFVLPREEEAFQEALTSLDEPQDYVPPVTLASLCDGDVGMVAVHEEGLVLYAEGDDSHQGVGGPSEMIPWAEVLKHAPAADLVAALKGRDGVSCDEIGADETFIIGKIDADGLSDGEGYGPATILTVVPKEAP